MAKRYLRDDFLALLRDAIPDAQLSATFIDQEVLSWAAGVVASAQPSSIYRQREGRTTVRFEWKGRGFFLKYHAGIGNRELLKNSLRGRRPVLGASDEYLAVKALTRAGVPTLAVAAFLQLDGNPARRQSLIVTDELAGTISLEDHCRAWRTQPPSSNERRVLLQKVADMVRGMHEAGINHRDLYLCHFHLDLATLGRGPLGCYLIDLHRAQIRSTIPKRWRVKDLSGLYFSAMDIGLSQRDLLRFVRAYSQKRLSQALVEDGSLWVEVQRKALALYRRHASSERVN